MAGWGAAAGGAASSATDWSAFAASRIINRGASRKAYKRQLEATEWLNSNRHQWEVEDLRKAGLNPILSVMKPGGSAGLNAPMSQAPTSPIRGSSALQSALMAKQYEKLDAEIDSIRTRTGGSKPKGIIGDFIGRQFKRVINSAPSKMIKDVLKSVNSSAHKVYDDNVKRKKYWNDRGVNSAWESKRLVMPRKRGGATR